MDQRHFTTPTSIILALDTSTRATSIAVARGAELLGSMTASDADEKRSETLWMKLRELLAEASLQIRDIDVFAVCTGPGGFTGLRVGVAAVKGLSAAASKPIVGITSLEAAAFAGRPAPAVCAMVNAYKGELYSQLFSFDATGVPVPRNDPLVSSIEKAVERVSDSRTLIFAGEGADAATEMITSVAVQREREWAIKSYECSVAEYHARLGLLKYSRGQVETAVSLKACYVRPSEAEIKLSLGLLGSKIKRGMKSE